MKFVHNKHLQQTDQGLFIQYLYFPTGDMYEAAINQFTDLLRQGGTRHSEIFGQLNLVVFHLDRIFALFQMIQQIVNITAADATKRQYPEAGHRTPVLTQRKLWRSNGIVCIILKKESFEIRIRVTSSSTEKVAGKTFFSAKTCGVANVRGA